MNKGVGLNFALSAIIVVTAGAAAVFAFQMPAKIEPATNAMITSLSIIFGLSVAITSMAIPASTASKKLSNDPIVAKRQADKRQNDDKRTLTRQKLLTWAALAAVLLGIMFLVAFETSPCATITRLIAAAFTSTAACALLFTLFLPNLLTSLVRRNAYLQSKSGVE